MFYFHRNRNLKPSVEFVNEDPKSIANKIEERKQLNKLAKMKCKKCCTTSTPEWRSGPNGKKSLCNACGLKWSKSQKKESTDKNSGINRAVKRRVHSFDFSTPTAKNSFLEDPSKLTTEDNDNKKLKEDSSVDLQKIDDENHSSKTSESINKFSLAYILS